MTPFLLKSQSQTFAPSIYSCKGGVSYDANENAALSLPVMLSGKIIPQMLPFGTLTISVQSSGDIAPDFDDVPLCELLEFHAGTQRSLGLPSSIPVTLQSALEGYAAPSGYTFAKMSLSAFVDLFPARVDEHYKPILSALYEDDGMPETYRGDNFHRGDYVYAVVPVNYDKLKVNFFPIYQGYLLQPVKVTTQGLEGVSWSFDFVTNVDRSVA